MIELRVNGQIRRIEAEPGTPLLYALRNELGLTGAKFACGLEQCGACKVILGGKAVPSCRLTVGDAAGEQITTVEGVGRDGRLHAVQQAFIEEQAVQCGFCTAGFVAAAVALLEINPSPSDDEIRAALQHHLCRCGVYARVLRAVRRAAGRPDGEPACILQDAPLPIPPEPEVSPLPSFVRSPGLDSWLRVDAEDTITLFAGKVEYGQGILTALAQIAAEELDVRLERIRVVTAHTQRTPNEGMTVGSMSLMTTGRAVRLAAAAARHHLLSLAYEELEARFEDLTVEDGTVIDRASGRSVSYWFLHGGQPFDFDVPSDARVKSPDEHRLLGSPEKRIDLLKKVTGAPVFLHDLKLPGMVHGRVLRPPRPGARLASLDPAAEGLSGLIRLVRDGSFLGLVARSEPEAAAALESLRGLARWEGGFDLPGSEDPPGHLKSRPAQSFHIADGVPVDGPIPPPRIPETSAQTLEAEYFRPFQMHASLGPSAAVALFENERLTLWVHSQGVFPIRSAVARVLGMEEADVTVIHVEGPGVYGHNGSDDAALDAALLARACPGLPVSLQWTREDEHRWEPYAPAMAVQMRAGLNAQGRIVGWDHEVWSYPHLGRASHEDGRTSALLASWDLEVPYDRPVPQPSSWSHSGGYRNADPLYDLPNKRIVKHFVADRPLRTSAMRGLGAFANVFAIESFMDELAQAAGQDPLAFRLEHLRDPRGRAVLQAVAELAGWTARPRPGTKGHGRGLAFARYKNMAAYCAVVVDLSIDAVAGAIRLERAFIAADSGQVVNADGLANQLEGGLIQAASWTLKEQVRYGPEGVSSADWFTYPILPFGETPEIRTVLLNRPGAPFLGSGEASSGPAGAAIANALFDATGLRRRTLPIRLAGE